MTTNYKNNSKELVLVFLQFQIFSNIQFFLFLKKIFKKILCCSQMEHNELGLGSFYHHPHQRPPAATLSPSTFVSPGATTAVSPPTNGLLPSNESANATALYPQSVVGKAPTSFSERVKRKRGRPRKYGTPEAAAAAKRSAASLSSTSAKKKERKLEGSPSVSSASKKSELSSLGNAGQNFTPHVISVATGEDVAHRIYLFTQQVGREVCILSASGAICNVSLRQPATSGGSVTYEGHFEILSLSGSYVREQGGRAGGLSACMSSANGQIIGGSVGGPLIAAGPVEVIVASFVIDPKKETIAGIKGDTSASRLPSPTGTPISTGFYRPVVEHSGRFLGPGSEDHQTMVENPFMIHQQGIHMPTSHATQWRGGLDTRSSGNYDFTGKTGPESNESPENGDYE